jgi:two-component system NtrC family sensor kinase
MRFTSANSPSSSDPQKRATTGELASSERLHMLGQLVAGVIHELNNPLNIVGANLKCLTTYVEQMGRMIDLYREGATIKPEYQAVLAELEEDLDWPYLAKDLPKVMGSCQEATKRAHSLVDELRRFSIKNKLEVGVVDVKGSILSTVRLVESSFRHKVSVVVELEQMPPIVGVAGQIQQVFMNLLVNACQAIDEKGSVQVRGRQHDNVLTIELTDTGSGIPADVLPRIFEPYFSTKSAADGTGLGLPITRRIIENHGGTMEVHSEVGVGTTFVITLPVEGRMRLGQVVAHSPYDF